MITVDLEIVPDPDDSDLALPFAELFVGDTLIRALLDSGAKRTSVIRRPGMVGPVEPVVGRGAFGTALSHETADLPVRFAGQDLGVLRVDVVPPEQPGHGDLIGQDVLSRYRCEYRLGHGLLILDGDPPGGSQPVFLDAGSHVYAELAWPGGSTALGVLDTGASITVVDSTFVDHHPDLFVPDGSSAGRDATGKEVATPMMTMAPVTLLGSPFASSKVAVVDLSAANTDLERPMDVIVGWPILCQGAFYVDHSARTASHRF